MLEAVTITLLAVLAFAAALGVGQLFGREPITAKCNPDACCMQEHDCDRRQAAQPRGL